MDRFSQQRIMFCDSSYSGSNSTRHDRVMANAIAEVEQDRSKLSGAGVIVSG